MILDVITWNDNLRKFHRHKTLYTHHYNARTHCPFCGWRNKLQFIRLLNCRVFVMVTIRAKLLPHHFTRICEDAVNERWNFLADYPLHVVAWWLETSSVSAVLQVNVKHRHSFLQLLRNCKVITLTFTVISKWLMWSLIRNDVRNWNECCIDSITVLELLDGWRF